MGRAIGPLLHGGGPAPVQQPRPRPLRNRCWTVVHGPAADALGIYSRWADVERVTAGMPEKAVHWFPSVAEARPFLEGGGFRADDVHW